VVVRRFDPQKHSLGVRL